MQVISVPFWKNCRHWASIACLAGAALNIPQSGLAATSACDLNQSGAVDSSDVQLELNEALGITSCTADINADGSCNVLDAQDVVVASLGGACGSGGTNPPPARNVLLQPFASNSIWNMPIGSGAVYKAAGITTPPASLTQDDDIIVLTPTAPTTPVDTNAAAWQSPSMDRCDNGPNGAYPNKTTSLTVPVPTNFILTSKNSLPAMGGTPNNSAAVLGADGKTVYNFQPLQRCTAGGPVTYLTNAIVANTNLYTDGIVGSHGGAWLSALGGTIRMGELVPGNSPIVNGVKDVIRHALKIEIEGSADGHPLLNNSVFPNNKIVWPAGNNDGANEGLLVALLPTFNYNGLSTAPGRSIAWTLINYGAYIVDDTAWNDMAICTELSPNADGSINRVYTEFQSSWGYTFDQSSTSNAWFKDIQTIMQNLQVVTNNSASAIGGGGTPRQPLLPAVTAP